MLLFQEIFGINDNIRGLAEKLADQGYLVLAPDMFWRLEPRFERKDESGHGRRDGPGPAAGLRAGPHRHGGHAGPPAGMPGCTGRVGAVGFCLGGTLAFLAAATAKPDGRGLDAAVPYYGSGIHQMLDLVPAIECPLLMHYGDEDPYIPAEQIALVEAALAGRADVTVHHYPAGHAFSNWDAPSFYRAEPAELAWQRTLAFLAEHLG